VDRRRGKCDSQNLLFDATRLESKYRSCSKLCKWYTDMIDNGKDDNGNIDVVGLSG
jgi:hypothetical protein